MFSRTLFIPTPEQVAIVQQSLQARRERAAYLGRLPDTAGEVVYESATRILDDNPELATLLRGYGQTTTMLALNHRIATPKVYEQGAMDVLEVLAVATTYQRLPNVFDVDS